MTDKHTTVLVLLNDAGQASIPLEVAAAIDESGIQIEVVAFFEPEEDTFGVDVHSLAASSQLDPRAYLRLIQLVRRLKPDIVHIHPNATGSIVRILLSVSDVALITTEHTLHDHFGSLKRVLNGVTNVLNEVVVANSEATKRSFATWEKRLYSVTSTSVEVIYNGVDLTAVKNSRKKKDPCQIPEGFIIGTVGRLVSAKNQAALLRAAAPVIEQREDVHVVLVGSGELKRELRELAKETGIAEHTHFLGHLPRQQVYATLAEFDVFAFPSKYEGFGVAVTEAMAAEVPVVANDIQVLREVLGEAGVYVDVNNEADFAKCLRELITDEKRREKLAKDARTRVESKFSLTNTVEAHVELYRSVRTDAEQYPRT